MSFANHNILDIALSIIPPTVVQIRKSKGTVVNKYGQTENTYTDWIEVYGIVQPGGEQNEHTNGVDFSKKHVTIWLRGISLDGTHIQWVPDQIRYVGCIFNVVGVKDWYPYDNYKECDCIEAMNLGESQRGIPHTAVKERVSARRKAKSAKNEDSAQQMLSFDAPPPDAGEAKDPLRKPTIFAADKEDRQTVPPPKPALLVGKARIKL